MKATGTEFYDAIINTFLYNWYDAFEETLTHFKSLKLKIYTWNNVIDLCAAIVVDSKRLESAGALNT